MKRYLALGVVAVAMFAFPGVASAQSGHFVGDQTCTDIGTQISCSGKVAGLGSTTFRIDVTAAGATADVECTNPGENVAPGQSFTFTPTGTTGTQQTPRSGSFRYTNLTTTAPTAPAGSCPNDKWTATVTDVTFTTATLSLFEGTSTTPSDTVTVTVQQERRTRYEEEAPAPAGAFQPGRLPGSGPVGGLTARASTVRTVPPGAKTSRVALSGPCSVGRRVAPGIDAG